MFACGMEASAVAVVTDERDWTRKYSFILGERKTKTNLIGGQ